MKHFVDISVSHPCIWDNVGRRQTLGPEMIKVFALDEGWVDKRVVPITSDDLWNMK